MPAQIEGTEYLRHPFDHIPSVALKMAIGVGAVATVGLGLMLLFIIENGPGFDLLAALVLSGTPAAAQEVLSQWSYTDRIYIAFVAGFDFLFGVVWTNTMALACIWVSRRAASARLASLGGLFAWLLWIAMVLDVPENGAYFLMVLGSVAQPWPAMAAIAVYPRIFIFIAGSLYLIVGSARSIGRA